MYGVRRPKYFNERDRRLQEHTDEKNRLLEAAREEDRLQSLEIALEGRLATTRLESARLKASSRTRRIAKARESALETIGSDFAVVPHFETLLEFLLATAARRSEALALLWTQTFLDAQTAFFPAATARRSRARIPFAHAVIGTACTLVWEDGGLEPAAYPISQRRRRKLRVIRRRGT
jgi:integrase